MESAGPDCIIPGQRRPIRVLGLQVRHRLSAKHPISVTRICSLVYCAKFILDLVSVSPLYFAAFMPWAGLSNKNILTSAHGICALEMVWLVMQLWPFPHKNAISFKALEPIGRELKTVGKVHLLPLLHSSTCNAFGHRL